MSNSQWNADQAAGERSLRTLQRQGELDSQLGHTLRATGIKTADLLAAVQVLYDQPGSRCVVSALRAIEVWLEAGGADV